ncbi:hypothetical protein C2S52_005106 [Perilla frutescens var. hirtella]|nr:hypothetical protein C2S52_005106 [Perilla frutescens var. hirtella]
MESITSHDEMLEDPKTVDEVIERFVSKNCLKRDRGDYYELEPTGVIINTDKFRWVQGLESSDECNLKDDDGRLHFSAPPLVFKFPKKLPANMTLESFSLQVIDKALDKFRADTRREALKKEKARKREALKNDDKMEAFGKARITFGNKPLQGLGGSWNSMVRGTCDSSSLILTKDKDDQTADAEAQFGYGKKLNAALDNCAACGGAGSSDKN